MGRKAKYSPSFKLMAVRMYIDDHLSCLSIARALGMNHSGAETLIRRWIKAYRVWGESAFQERKRNSSYTAEFKIKVAQEYLSGEGSLVELAVRYGISSSAVIYQWVSKYSSHKELRDYCPKPEVYMTATRKTAKKTTQDERKQIIDWFYDNGCSYTETAAHFGCSYGQVYSWVKKFDAKGIDGLSDKRGRRKPDEERTPEELRLLEEDRKDKRIKQLERELELLKKLREIDWG
jgi:transposase-like protein